jgi:hypothetical protein
MQLITSTYIITFQMRVGMPVLDRPLSPGESLRAVWPQKAIPFGRLWRFFDESESRCFVGQVSWKPDPDHEPLHAVAKNEIIINSTCKQSGTKPARQLDRFPSSVAQHCHNAAAGFLSDWTIALTFNISRTSEWRTIDST